MAQSKLPNKSDPYAFRYRILASVDIIGSSEIKGRSAGDAPSWVKVFQQFFADFPAALESAYDNLRAAMNTCEYFPRDKLSIWKFVGDEILFRATLSRHEETSIHCIALTDALSRFTTENRKKHHSNALRLKSTIWGAGFPVTNIDVEADDHATDMLGPSIDLGFRLTAFATERKTPVSADVAWLLMKAAVERDLLNKVHMTFDGVMSLRGVNGGVPYPVFWIDRLGGQETPEDRLLGGSRKANPADVVQYLEAYFDEAGPRIRRPFIVTDRRTEFAAVPSDIQQARENLIATDSDLAYRTAAQAPGTTGTRGKGSKKRVVDALEAIESLKPDDASRTRSDPTPSRSPTARRKRQKRQ